MFKCEISDVKLFRDSFDAIADLIDEAELTVTKDGINMTASDRAVVSVVNFFLSRGAFDSYEYEKDLKLGVNLAGMMQVLRRSKDEKMTLAVEGNKITLSFHGSSKRHFTLPVIDVSKEETPDLAKLESGFTTNLFIDSELLAGGVEDAELVGDSVVFTVRNDILILNAENDTSSTRLEIQPSSALDLQKVPEPVRARYSVDYLKKMLKAKKLASRAKISLSSEYPMKISFDVPEKLNLSFILAPRVEEN